jgi:hypothetical protein
VHESANVGTDQTNNANLQLRLHKHNLSGEKNDHLAKKRTESRTYQRTEK